MTRFTIRRAGPGDMAEWLRMRLALWPDHQAGDLQPEMEAMLADPAAPVWVAERPEGGLCAFLEGGTRPYADGCETRPVGYIEGWYVDEDVRRLGIGRQLVSAAEQWARDRGLKEMGSDTWLENEASIQAHLALGYQEAERLVHFIRKL